MKARIEELNCYYYPDVMVTCDERDRTTNTFKRYPCLIVEVLSEATEAFDRGDKFADYRQIESLQEYVLISQTRLQVDVFRRNEEGLWVLHPYGEGDRVLLASVGWEGAIADFTKPLISQAPKNTHQRRTRTARETLWSNDLLQKSGFRAVNRMGSVKGGNRIG